jgi:hypothetical protein
MDGMEERKASGASGERLAVPAKMSPGAGLRCHDTDGGFQGLVGVTAGGCARGWDFAFSRFRVCAVPMRLAPAQGPRAEAVRLWRSSLVGGKLRISVVEKSWSWAAGAGSVLAAARVSLTVVVGCPRRRD